MQDATNQLVVTKPSPVYSMGREPRIGDVIHVSDVYWIDLVLAGQDGLLPVTLKESDFDPESGIYSMVVSSLDPGPVIPRCGSGGG